MGSSGSKTLANNYVEIPGSFRDPPIGDQAIAAVRHSHPAEPIEVCVYLKAPDDDSFAETGTDDDRDSRRPLYADSAFSQNDSQNAAEIADGMAKIERFATQSGLSVVKQDPARRLVKLVGTVDKMEAAFRTKLQYYHDGKTAFRARAGSLSAPADV